MKNKFLLILNFMLIGCSTLSKNNFEIVLKQDSTVREQGEPEKKFKANEVVSIKKFPVVIESPSYASLVIASVPQGDQLRVDVSLRPLDSWSGEVFEKKLTHHLVEILSNVNKIQILLSGQKNDEALQLVVELQSKFPNLSWLGFLKASILTASGKYKEAKIILDLTLKDYPDDTEGLKLLKILENKKSD